MSLFYVTGIAGAGKSEVYHELKNRGHEVYGTDENQFAGFYNNQTNERVDNPSDHGGQITAAWREYHTWKLPRKTVEDLKDKSKGKNVFLCGVASNDTEFLDLFDKLFALIIDNETLHHRITSRTNNSFGKNEGELDQIKAWQANTAEYYDKYSYITIDASQPIKTVVDDILMQV
ncbi:MAG TPA: AAA family ATPase [Candidatus Saccharimonadales bacterium]|jgi:adenylate kinase family enzyme